MSASLPWGVAAANKQKTEVSVGSCHSRGPDLCLLLSNSPKAEMILLYIGLNNMNRKKSGP